MSWSLHDERAEHAEPEPDPWVPQSAESHALACATINDVCRELAKRKEDYMGSILDHFASATRPCGLTEREKAAAYDWLRDKALDTPDTAPIVYLADGNGSPLECQQLVGAELDAAMRRVLEGRL